MKLKHLLTSLTFLLNFGLHMPKALLTMLTEVNNDCRK